MVIWFIRFPFIEITFERIKVKRINFTKIGFARIDLDLEIDILKVCLKERFLFRYNMIKLLLDMKLLRQHYNFKRE